VQGEDKRQQCDYSFPHEVQANPSRRSLQSVRLRYAIAQCGNPALMRLVCKMKQWKLPIS
jgi:hypothetical protein